MQQDSSSYAKQYTVRVGALRRCDLKVSNIFQIFKSFFCETYGICWGKRIGLAEGLNWDGFWYLETDVTAGSNQWLLMPLSSPPLLESFLGNARTALCSGSWPWNRTLRDVQSHEFVGWYCCCALPTGCGSDSRGWDLRVLVRNDTLGGCVKASKQIGGLVVDLESESINLRLRSTSKQWIIAKIFDDANTSCQLLSRIFQRHIELVCWTRWSCYCSRGGPQLMRSN